MNKKATSVSIRRIIIGCFLFAIGLCLSVFSFGAKLPRRGYSVIGEPIRGFVYDYIMDNPLCMILGIFLLMLGCVVFAKGVMEYIVYPFRENKP